MGLPEIEAGVGAIKTIVEGSLSPSGSVISLDPIKHVTDVLGGIFGGSSGIDFKQILKEFFASDPARDAIATLIDKLANNGAARDAFKTLINELAKVLQALDNATEDIRKELAKLLAAILKEIINLLQTIIEQLRGAITGLFDKLGEEIKNNLPTGILKGPLEVMHTIRQLQDVLTELGRAEEIVRRLTVTFSSLRALVQIGAGDDLANFMFGSFSDGIEDDIKELLDPHGDDPLNIIKDHVVKFLLPSGLLIKLFEAVKNNTLWKWADFPSGLGPGKLHTWLNDFTNGKFQTDSNVDDPVKHPLERQFRVRLASNIDAYFRKTGERFLLQHGLRTSDERISTQIVSDVITIVFDTVITFTLEPECFPLTEAEWEHFEDVGVQFAAAASRQIKAAIRSVTGTLLRGVWIWSVENENLIEAIGTIIGSVLTSICEGIVRNLAFTFRIVSRYENDSVSPADIVANWDGGEFYDKVLGPGQADGRLQYVALLRAAPNGVSQAVKNAVNNNAFILGLLQDIGAYTDMSYRQFRLDSRFPDIQADTVNITFIGTAQGSLLIKATTTGTDAPRPVLRAYCCCQVVVMTPAASAGGEYEAALDMAHLPKKITVTVLSNRGGRHVKSQTLP